MKQVATTLTSVLENPAMELIRNRKKSVIALAEEQIAAWSLDLYTRNPGPAVREGEFVGTDLDMATFLTALGNRGAVISLPKEYQKMRAATTRENERTVANENRHGRITGLWSNKEVFSFGVRIHDANVVTTDPTTGKETVGAPRNFALVGIEGDWHTGWSPIVFSPTAKENDFLNDKALWTDNQVFFKNFVHPNRWISLYGQYYLIGKALVQRLDEEAKFLDGEVKRLIAAGVSFPQGKAVTTTPYRKTTKTGEEQTKKVQAFQVEVDYPSYDETYTYKERTSTDLVNASDTRRNIIYNLKPRLQFALRSVELAFVQNGFRDPEHTEHKMPGWMKDTHWEDAYVPLGKRNVWRRLVLFQPGVGQQGVAIRYRFYEKTEHVAAPEPE